MMDPYSQSCRSLWSFGTVVTFPIFFAERELQMFVAFQMTIIVVYSAEPPVTYFTEKMVRVLCPDVRNRINNLCSGAASANHTLVVVVFVHFWSYYCSENHKGPQRLMRYPTNVAILYTFRFQGRWHLRHFSPFLLRFLSSLLWLFIPA